MFVYLDADGIAMAQGTADTPLATVQAIFPSVTEKVECDGRLVLYREGVSPYHQRDSGQSGTLVEHYSLVYVPTQDDLNDLVIIQDYRPDGSDSRYYSEINYKTELDRRLHRVDTFSRGELVQTIYYAEFDGTTPSVPVVREDSVYEDDVFSLPTKRTMTISWYGRDGLLVDGAVKVLEKWYEGIAQLHASRRRRSNVYNILQQQVLGMLVATAPAGGLSTDPVVVIETGRAFLVSLDDDFNLWVDTASETGLVDKITNGTELWLDNVVNVPEAGDTIRDYALWELR